MEHSLEIPALSSSVDTLDGLLEKMRQIELASDGLDEEFAAFVGSLDETTKQAFEEIYDAYYDLPRDDPISMSEYWRTRGQGLMPLEMIQNLQGFEAAQQEWKGLSDTLDQRFGKELGQYVADEARSLLASVDLEAARRYEQWEHTQPDRDWSTGLSYILGSLQNLTEVTSVPSYYQASIDFDRLEKFRALLEEKGVLGAVTQPKEVTHDREELQRAQDLRFRYRGDLYGRPLDEALTAPLLPSHDYAVNLDYEQLAALEHHLRSIDINSQLERLDVTGLETLPFALTPQEVKAMLRGIPPIAFDGVSSLDFSGIVREDAEPNALWEGEKVTLGRHAHWPVNNVANITINSDEVAQSYGVFSSYSEVFAKQVALEEVKETVLHEFGHALHYKLPVALLQRWDEAVAGEEAYVTDYVAEKTKRHGSERARQEDFADSFMLYLTKPAKLRDIAAARYAAMADIYAITTAPAMDWFTPQARP